MWATDIDVLPLDRVVRRQPGFLVIRSPSNPAHYWGTLLLFDDAPSAGDGGRWEALFDEAVADEPRVRHRTFAWDRTDGACGAADEEFAARGYDIEKSVGLVATSGELVPHARENRRVAVRELDPAMGADEALWSAVLELQVAGRDEREREEVHRSFARARLEDQRVLFRAGRGGWYAAIDPASGEVVGSCGVVVSAGRARFQTVVTAPAHRRRGVCSRLVVEAARRAGDEYAASHFVIVADAGYHALALYTSLGFQPRETVVGACLPPRSGS